MTGDTKILVVEDAPEFSQLLQSVFEREGHQVEVVETGGAAVDLTRTWQPDVVVLDLVLPGLDGIEVCRQIRTFSDCYVLMLTSRDEEIDKLVGLAIGADDYVTKPFSPKEVVARVGALLRRPRAAPGADERLEHGELRVDVVTREAHVGPDLVALTNIEFDLLATLLQRPGMVFTRSMLLEQVWGSDWGGDTHLVDVHVANLRKKIDLGEASHILTVRGVGYRLA